jgi:hypothetical protein
MLPLPRRCRDEFLKNLPLPHRYRGDLLKNLPLPRRHGHLCTKCIDYGHQKLASY